MNAAAMRRERMAVFVTLQKAKGLAVKLALCFDW